MNPDTEISLLDYLAEASQTVSHWPNWKKSGSDASRFQSEHNRGEEGYHHAQESLIASASQDA